MLKKLMLLLCLGAFVVAMGCGTPEDKEPKEPEPKDPGEVEPE